MGLAYGHRPERRPQQLSVVRRVLPENGFRTWLTDLKHALAGRVCVSSVVEGLSVEVANLSVVSGVSRLQRRPGGMRESDIDALNGVLGVTKPNVAARVRNPEAPLYVADGELRIGFLLDPEVLRRAASAALAGYCTETLGSEHKAFRPLEELGELTLGTVRPAPEGGPYRRAGFASAAELGEFCSDPNEFLAVLGRATDNPESLIFGPMGVESAPQAARELINQGVR